MAINPYRQPALDAAIRSHGKTQTRDTFQVTGREGEVDHEGTAVTVLEVPSDPAAVVAAARAYEAFLEGTTDSVAEAVERLYQAAKAAGFYQWRSLVDFGTLTIDGRPVKEVQAEGGFPEGSQAARQLAVVDELLKLVHELLIHHSDEEPF